MQIITPAVLHNTLYFNDIPVLIYNIKYPVFTSTCNQDAVRSINQFYSSLAKEKEDYCKTVLYPQAVESARYIQKNFPPFHSYEYDMVYKVTFNSGCITSLYVDQYTFMGGAHGSTVRTSDTWSLSTGRRISLQDIYPHEPLYRQKIRLSIQSQIAGLLKDNPASFFDDYPKLLLNTFDPDSFYLSPDGVIIYFQQYDIAPYASGLPEFLLPCPAGRAGNQLAGKQFSNTP
ncbi:DUF3298 and DUF4163 domain-containing protein [[Clostridium] symbiosum]|uniref:DUF3298 and DUF4163 domain-containing protein n=1 Tax=Clostridium symbiosum TaxID=1512 RepID=UPI001D075865|nr:DUF3298 and DUF4163 domain-containing protein [[Clostridium] symbiosum]MCB6610925.1 DUF3298 and DUF4163 domain-containing protein [[Clostridium] symbiosum]MCB6931629.1 DUF3298 and DUF4163 domain-containing protein [[Clostridium] symbiosum]